jgi:antitoxin ParD1/3/4
MAMVKKSISLTVQQDAWIRQKLESGDFGNESEVIRDLIRHRQSMELAEQTTLQTLREALQEGELGEARRLDLDAIWARAKERRG